VPGSTPSVTWEDYVRELGHELHRRRVAAGLSQEELAYRAGITRAHYQQLEKGAGHTLRPANPSLKTLVGLAQILGAEVADLVGSAAGVDVGGYGGVVVGHAWFGTATLRHPLARIHHAERLINRATSRLRCHAPSVRHRHARMTARNDQVR
jgi:transcriptional regulator with XRE-family HTH domain